MENIKVLRSELLTTLKANRAKHREIFLEAQEKYKELAIQELEAMLAEAKNGKVIRRQLSLQAPADQTRDYDCAIKMVEMSVDAHIELSERDFQSFVMDDWNWKRQFLSANALYSKSASDTLAIESSRGEY